MSCEIFFACYTAYVKLERREGGCLIINENIMSNLGLGLGLGLVLRLITLKTSHLVALNSTSPPSRLSFFTDPFILGLRHTG